MSSDQSQVKTLTTADNISVWTSPIFADVREWEICTKTGSPIYVLECKTTKGPLLEWYYDVEKDNNSNDGDNNLSNDINHMNIGSRRGNKKTSKISKDHHY